MADTVQLRVQLNGADLARTQLKAIDELLDSIRGKRSVQIKIDTNSITRAANQSKKLADNLDKINQGGAAMGGKNGAGGAIDDLGKKADKAAKSTNFLANGVKNVFKMAAWQLSGKAVSAVFKAFSDGLATMKEVDSQLVSIRKVTDLTNSEIEQLTDTAYSLASAYGRTADEVLNASVTFARAGYGDQIEQLSELSLLLQNVGDLQADQASEFLIATDKAYKLNGSYTDLMTVIDGLNEITNRNATDMQKMTEGMTVAGSVFAESGESIETFAALLGTATANTQRSGSEMARGLRTILMNIRQIRGETEDGELIDGESIANASKALKEYANISTMENGQLRKASDVLRELAGRWDELDSVQQSAIAEAVAGKRQANVLTTLMGDWETVEKMISDYVNGAGSAMEENAIYLESWEAKSAQLKATWTEFMSDLVDTDFVKGSLDVASSFIKVLDEIIKTDYNRATDGANEVTSQLQKEIEERNSLIAQGDKLGSQEKIRLEYLKQHVKLLQQQEAEARTHAFNEWQDSVGVGNRNGNVALTRDQMVLRDMQSALTSANTGFAEGSLNAQGYADAIGEIIAQYGDYALTAKDFMADGQNITDTQRQIISTFDAVATAASENSDAIFQYAANVGAAVIANGGTAEEAADAAKAAYDELNGESPEITINTNAEEAVSQVQSAGAAVDAIDGKTANMYVNVHVGGGLGGFGAIGGFAGGTDSAPGGPTLVNEEGPEIIAANGLAWIAGGGRPSVTVVPRGAQVYTASETRNMMRSGAAPANAFPAFKGGTASRQDFLNIYTGSHTTSGQQEKAWRIAEQLLEDLGEHPVRTGANAAASSSGDWTDWGGGGGGPTPPNFEELEKALKETLKNLDLQAELAENQEDFQRAMEIYGQAQSEINNLLEQYRANGYAEDSDEILTLANKGYDYAGKQLKDYDTLRDRLIDALNDLTKATEDANDLAERQEAVDKARESLANAERQRTVRVFNPVTGQWEWVANAGDIQRAQENLKSAEEALRKEQIDQTISALKNADKSSFEDVPIAEALWSLMSGAPGDVQSALLGKWGAAIGGSSHMASAEAVTPFNQGNTNIGTQYNFGNISLTEEQAANMTVKQLADELRVLNIL